MLENIIKILETHEDITTFYYLLGRARLITHFKALMGCRVAIPHNIAFEKMGWKELFTLMIDKKQLRNKILTVINPSVDITDKIVWDKPASRRCSFYVVDEFV